MEIWLNGLTISFLTLIWYSACKTPLEAGFRTWWPGLSTPLLPHHSEDGTFGILLIDWIRGIQLSHPDLCWLSNADSSKNCLWLQEWLPLAIGSGSVLSRQRTWCSAITVTAVILRFPNAFRPDVRHTELGLILELHESQSNFQEFKLRVITTHIYKVLIWASCQAFYRNFLIRATLRGSYYHSHVTVASTEDPRG